MADNFLNLTGLSYYHNRIKNLFALQSGLDALEDRVEAIETEGGEPNVIETVKVNGIALTPDAQKAVNILTPVTTIRDGYLKIDDDEDKSIAALFEETADGVEFSYLSDNYPVSTTSLASTEYVDENGGKIDTISVNGTQQTITNKNVDITVPTATSDLTNDSNYQTDTQVQASIAAAVASAYKYKGSVATVADLPATATVGDVYDVQDTGTNYAWNGSSWDALGQIIDATAFWSKTELTAVTTAQIDTLFA